MSGRSHHFGPGDRFAGYDIIQEVGRGSSGTVYRAKHRLFGDEVALKIIPIPDSDRLDNEEFAESFEEAKLLFERECRAIGKLRKARHPNLIRVDDAGEFAGNFFFSMDYLNGSSLEKIMRNGIDPLHGLRVCAEVASALEVVHQCGIVHRDVKPANIMITNQQITKLVDFGIAKHLEYIEDITTILGVEVGTLAFASPEQLPYLPTGKKRAPLDRRSDIFSTGKVLYHVLTGEPISFSGTGIVKEFRYFYEWQPKRPESHDLYHDAFPIISKMVAQDPEDRYETSKQASVELFQLLDCHETKSHPCLDLQTIISNALESNGIDSAILQGPFAFLSPESYHKLTGIKYDVKCKGFEKPLVPRRGSKSRYVIGRNKESDVHIQNEAVSRFHATLHSDFRIGDKSVYRIKDEGSQYGVLVNGKRESERLLDNGDILSFTGDISLVFSTTADLAAKINDNRKNLQHYLGTARSAQR